MPLISSANKRKLIQNLALLLQRKPSPLVRISRFSLIKRLSKFYIAGEKLEDTIRVAKKLKDEGKLATIDSLGEETKNRKHANETVAEYMALLSAIQKESLVGTADISLKLTQLGLNIDKDFCIANLIKILEFAENLGITVWVDMEDRRYTQVTVDIIDILKGRFLNLRAVIQSMMKSSNDHVSKLLMAGATIRLCKGAYKETPDVAYQDRGGDIKENFIRLMKIMLKSKIYHGIATHDEDIIKATMAFAEGNQIPKSGFEFQMLYGVKKDLQDSIVKKGYNLRIYVPFGAHWLPYFLRRIAENPDIVHDFTHDIIETFQREYGIDIHWLHPN